MQLLRSSTRSTTTSRCRRKHSIYKGRLNDAHCSLSLTHTGWDYECCVYKTHYMYMISFKGTHKWKESSHYILRWGFFGHTTDFKTKSTGHFQYKAIIFWRVYRNLSHSWSVAFNYCIYDFEIYFIAFSRSFKPTLYLIHMKENQHFLVYVLS